MMKINVQEKVDHYTFFRPYNLRQAWFVKLYVCRWLRSKQLGDSKFGAI